MEFEVLAGGIVAGLLGLSVYSQYKGKKISERAKARMSAFKTEQDLLVQQFQGQYRETKELGLSAEEVCRLYEDNFKRLHKKHNLVMLTLDASIPGEFEAQKEVHKSDGTIEKYVSNENKWIKYE